MSGSQTLFWHRHGPNLDHRRGSMLLWGLSLATAMQLQTCRTASIKHCVCLCECVCVRARVLCTGISRLQHSHAAEREQICSKMGTFARNLWRTQRCTLNWISRHTAADQLISECSYPESNLFLLNSWGCSDLLSKPKASICGVCVCVLVVTACTRTTTVCGFPQSFKHLHMMNEE